MFHKLDEILQRHDELTSMLGDPSITQDPQQLRQIMREHARLQEIVDAYRRFKTVCQQLDDNVELLSVDDPELRQLVREEQQQLQLEREALEADIQRLLIPPDPRDARDVFLEVRAGTGGEEAALFAASLFRMYSRYAASQGWRLEIISASESERGGLREIIARVSGDGVFSRLKFESGTHRVQRVPETESQGRIHTSAVTVAILPEVDEVEVQIDESDLRIDVYRSSGAGGQHVNTTDSAVRITHLPTKVVTQCQSERSQHQNKATAMKMLRALLADHLQQTQRDSVAADRRQQVGSGDRSERIRTYNFPQSRITDHRINFTTHRLAQVLEGQVEEVIDPLRAHFQAEALKEASA